MSDTATAYANAVSAHYTAGDLGEKILAGLRDLGKDPDALQVDDLTEIDQFHWNGAEATRALMGRAALEPGMRVLDVGGGLGGSARLIAHEAGCIVTVLDLSEEFCQVGAMLTARVGLADRVAFQHGSALDMPFPDSAFDRVWMQHASMNIAAKERLFREVSRVLRPGGWLAMHEMMAGPIQPIHFPVPWAPDASISSLSSSTDIRALLTEVGFHEVAWVDEREAALAAMEAARSGAAPGQSGAVAPPLGVHLVIGPRIVEMLRNTGRNFREDRLTMVQAVFARG